MRKEKSCGAVVYKKEHDNLYYLIIKQSKGHVAFPKGHVEGNETNEETAIREIKEIIANPYFVYYDNLRKSLLYFKQLDENVCVVVKLILKKNTNCYVATLYPISKKKIERYLSMKDRKI